MSPITIPFLIISLLLLITSTHTLSLPPIHTPQTTTRNTTITSSFLSPRQSRVSGSCNTLENRLNVPLEKGAVAIDYFDADRAWKLCSSFCSAGGWHWPPVKTEDYSFHYVQGPEIKMRVRCAVRYKRKVVFPGNIRDEVCNNMFWTVRKECGKYGGELEDLDDKAVYEVSGFRMK
ncbi:MAG: hypothetical protein LQ345_002115 [Seirophora villosa]|nr:MAG: hypothetical protein LQ345_002115 [Seirophora villosa]